MIEFQYNDDRYFNIISPGEVGQITIKVNSADICSLDLSDKNKNVIEKAVSKRLPPVPGMIILTFFLWEIIQKKILAWDFHILATQKKFFHGPGGSQWGPGGLLAHFGAKNGYF